MPPATFHIPGVSRFAVIVTVASSLVVVLAVLHDPSRPSESVGPRTAVEAGGLALDSVRAARALRRASIRQADTYLSHAVREDSLLRRWADRRGEPIAVYLPTSAVAAGYSPELQRAVAQAFRRWERVRGVPVRFAFVRDPSTAEVVVHWLSRLSGDRAGEANVEWDPHGWLRRGTLTLATMAQHGAQLATDAVYTVALHEIGHLLGLGHSDAAADLMYPSPGVHDLTSRDERTARLLYSLSPGSLRDPIVR
jgi:hypothetical protein